MISRNIQSLILISFVTLILSGCVNQSDTKDLLKPDDSLPPVDNPGNVSLNTVGNVSSDIVNTGAMNQNYSLNTLTLVFPFEYNEKNSQDTALFKNEYNINSRELGLIDFSYQFSDIFKRNSDVSSAVVEFFTIQQNGYNKDNLEYAFDRIIYPPVSKFIRDKKVVERTETVMDHYLQIKYILSSFEENPEFYEIHYLIKQNVDNRQGYLYHILFIVNHKTKNPNYISEEEYQSIISTINITSPLN